MITKQKTCKVCKSKFTTYTSFQKVCGVDCSIVYAKQEQAKRDRAETKKKLKKLKTLGEHKKELQVIFNKFIRLRDEKEPCISCQRHHKGQFHCGHYLTVGARPELRYDEQNCHKQCAPCNNHLSGNLVNYRINLVKKIGLKAVERLESDHTPKHYTIADIEQMKKHYRAQIRELEARKAA